MSTLIDISIYISKAYAVEDITPDILHTDIINQWDSASASKTDYDMTRGGDRDTL